MFNNVVFERFLDDKLIIGDKEIDLSKELYDKKKLASLIDDSICVICCGNEYTFNYYETVYTYKMGEILSELERIPPYLKYVLDAIKCCESYNAPLSSVFVGLIVSEFKRGLVDKMGYISSEIISLKFAQIIKRMCVDDHIYTFKSVKEIFKEDISLINDIFNEDDNDDKEIECCGQLMLLAYLFFKKDAEWISDICLIESYFIFLKQSEIRKYNKLNPAEMVNYLSNENGKRITVELTMIGTSCANKYHFTKIDDLLQFDFTNSLDSDVVFKTCPNCGKHFPVYGRSDSIYCSFPVYGYKGKTCKDIGAQKAWLNKEKNDEVTGRYRKIYMRLKMRAKRHPYDKEIEKLVGKLIDEGKIMRKKYEQGAITLEEFMEWLNKFDDIK